MLSFRKDSKNNNGACNSSLIIKNVKKNLVLVKTILKSNLRLRVVLNGGKYELEDSTIPFQIGFDSSIAEQKPSYILVIDVTDDDSIKSAISDNCEPDDQSERTIFRLEPIHYLQLKRPGVHHLIFILFNEMSRSLEKFYLEKSQYCYENAVYFNTIEGIELDNQISYAEAVVDVPKEFFADEPETSFQKAIYSWVNSWYRLKPVDECEYRKRKIIGFTIKPLLWLLGFAPRVIVAVFLSVSVFVMKFIAFLFGWQPVSFLPKKKEMWIDFLFLYPITGYEDVFKQNFWFGKTERGERDTDCYGHKMIAIGKKRFYIPTTISGLMFYASSICVFIGINHKLVIGDTKGLPLLLVALSVFILALVTAVLVFFTLPTLKFGKEWEAKWDIETPKGKKLVIKVTKWIFIPLVVITIVSCILPYVSWTGLSNFVFGFLKYLFFLLILLGISYLLTLILSPVVKKQIEKIKAKMIREEKIVKISKAEIQMDWLQKSFDIEKLPERVSFKTAPASSSVLHEFTIGFWRLKAKVCKPYAKK